MTVSPEVALLTDSLELSAEVEVVDESVAVLSSEV